MPLQLHPITQPDLLSWTRIRSLAYYGPTHDVLHSGPIRESSIHATAADRAHDLSKPNTFYWKIVDTSLPPSADDPPTTNGGRTIAVSYWSMCNIHVEQQDAETKTTEWPQRFLPPELRLDALHSLFTPLRTARAEIMGAATPYLMLHTLATHPEHQRRGAASMLLDWGLKKADEEGLVVYLDATSVARPVYEKRGFVVVRGVEWDRRVWGGEGSDWHWCMVRGVGKGGEGLCGGDEHL